MRFFDLLALSFRNVHHSQELFNVLGSSSALFSGIGCSGDHGSDRGSDLSEKLVGIYRRWTNYCRNRWPPAGSNLR